MAQLYPWIFIGFGLFTLAGAIGNWEWFMNSRKARRLSRLITRNGARIFYSVLGIALMVLGSAMLFEWISLAKK